QLGAAEADAAAGDLAAGREQAEQRRGGDALAAAALADDAERLARAQVEGDAADHLGRGAADGEGAGQGAGAEHRPGGPRESGRRGLWTAARSCRTRVLESAPPKPGGGGPWRQDSTLCDKSRTSLPFGERVPHPIRDQIDRQDE